VVPSSQCLLQAVDGLVEPAHQLMVGGVNEVCGLGAVDRLGECAVEDGILDVEVVHGTTPGNDQSLTQSRWWKT
jgi:hypothetical protein